MCVGPNFNQRSPRESDGKWKQSQQTASLWQNSCWNIRNLLKMQQHFWKEGKKSCHCTLCEPAFSYSLLTYRRRDVQRWKFRSRFRIFSGQSLELNRFVETHLLAWVVLRNNTFFCFNCNHCSWTFTAYTSQNYRSDCVLRPVSKKKYVSCQIFFFSKRRGERYRNGQTRPQNIASRKTVGTLAKLVSSLGYCQCFLKHTKIPPEIN